MYTHIHNVNISKVKWFNELVFISLYYTGSRSCSVPHILSKTEPTLQRLLKSSSESILLVIKIKPLSGLVFLVRNELEVDVLQKTICYIISFSSTFGEGEGLHQAAFKYRDCLQMWGLFANTLQLGKNFIFHFNEG